MHLRALILGFTAFTILQLHAALAPRTWTSKDGAASMTATFHKIEGGKVTLIQTNGRSQIVDATRISDADMKWIAENGAAPTGLSGDPAPPASGKMAAALAGNLIDDHGRPAKLDPKAAAAKYFLFYYSASWCGPCHAFTPDLVQFARKMKGRQASLTIILSPSDKTPEDEVAYMKEMRMPWLALALDKKDAAGIPHNQSGYIPAMVLANADGKCLLQVNEKLSKEEFLKKTETLTAHETSGATASN